MALRFRRTIRLFPGVRVNLSKGGASLSVGPRGASLTFSPRGAHATFGIPGTGMHWTERLGGSTGPGAASSTPRVPIRTSQEFLAAAADPDTSIVYMESGRRLSAQQLVAAHRKLVRKETRQAAEREVRQVEEALDAVLNCWRAAPTVPTPEDYQRALDAQPFRFHEARPAEPRYDVSKLQLADETFDTVRIENPVPGSRRAIAPASSLVAGVLVAGCVIALALTATAAIVVGAVVGLLVLALTRHHVGNAWGQHVRQLADARLGEAWPARRAEMQAKHEIEVKAYEARAAEAESAWIVAEHERIAWGQRLLAGDMDALDETLASTISDIDFPFESTCEAALANASTAFLHLDLPEIEDVVPEVRLKALKDGRIKEVKRAKDERHMAYADLVTGLGLQLAATAFAAVPSLQTLYLAAYTQRRQSGSLGVSDDYVYEATFNRDAIRAVDFAKARGTDALSAFPHVAELTSSFEFKKIPAPSWASEFNSGGPVEQ